VRHRDCRLGAVGHWGLSSNIRFNERKSISQSRRDEDIVRVDDQVFLVTGSNTNWVIVKDDSDATLRDTGYQVITPECSPRWPPWSWNCGM
jgi:hypothetical protein